MSQHDGAQPRPPPRSGPSRGSAPALLSMTRRRVLGAGASPPRPRDAPKRQRSRHYSGRGGLGANQQNTKSRRTSTCVSGPPLRVEEVPLLSSVASSNFLEHRTPEKHVPGGPSPLFTYFRWHRQLLDTLLRDDAGDDDCERGSDVGGGNREVHVHR